MKVLVSNGSNKFHLAPLAVELDKKNVLAGLLTSGWPTDVMELLVRPFSKHPAVRRYLDRKESIKSRRVFASNFSELIFQIGIRLRRISENVEQRFDLLGFWWYSAYAKYVLDQLRPNIYHYRACYGLGSVVRAKQLGIITICDHSIAHPDVLQYMVDNNGAWPSKSSVKYSGPLQCLMRRDLQRADHVFVNSEFVKETCVFSGLPESRVHTIYWGVDEKFLVTIPSFDINQVAGRVGQPLLFAGGIQRRKGIRTLAEAFHSLPASIKLRLIGGREAGLGADPVVMRFFSDSRVQSLDIVPRADLASHMLEAPVFIFPSYCEGSARVIFEAMACGCFIITTPNAGSIVRNMEHGLVVPPGDATALAAAIQWAVDSPEHVARIGWTNSQLIRAHYRQEQYGEKVIEIYRQILESSRS